MRWPWQRSRRRLERVRREREHARLREREVAALARRLEKKEDQFGASFKAALGGGDT